MTALVHDCARHTQPNISHNQNGCLLLQDEAASYKQATTDVKDELELAMSKELEVLQTATIVKDSRVDDPYLEQQRLVRQRATRAELEVVYGNLERLEKVSGVQMTILKEMQAKLEAIDIKPSPQAKEVATSVCPTA